MSCMTPTSLVDFFPTAQMRLAFLKRYEEDPSYLQLPADEHAWDDVFRYELGYGVISPCYLVNLPALLSVSRKRMLERGVLLEERFDREDLIVEGGLQLDGQGKRSTVGTSGMKEGRVRYRDISAGQVVFCDGIESFTNPYFSRLPFAPNKGEALVVEIPELSQAGKEDTGNGDARGRAGAVFKKGISLAPWKEGLYWVGASYEWAFDHGEPTEAFRKRTEALLQEWLKVHS